MTKNDFILQSLLLQSATNLDPTRAVERAEKFWKQWCDTKRQPEDCGDSVSANPNVVLSGEPVIVPDDQPLLYDNEYHAADMPKGLRANPCGPSRRKS